MKPLGEVIEAGPLEWKAVSRLGVNLPALAGKPGANKTVIRYSVTVPGTPAVSMVGPVGGHWGIDADSEYGTRMLAKYLVREHGPLDLSTWTADTPIVGVPAFYEDVHGNVRVRLRVSRDRRLDMMAAPTAHAMRMVSELHAVVLTSGHAVSSVIVAYLHEPGGRPLTVVPAKSVPAAVVDV